MRKPDQGDWLLVAYDPTAGVVALREFRETMVGFPCVRLLDLMYLVPRSEEAKLRQAMEYVRDGCGDAYVILTVDGSVAWSEMTALAEETLESMGSGSV